jgi:hypothetical protein
LKTVAELSKELNISTQALYKRIKACNLTVDNGGLKVVNHVNHVTPQGEAILKGVETKFDSMVTNQVTNPLNPVTNQVDNLATEFTTFLQEQIRLKDDQIATLQGELTAERDHSRSLSLELVTIAKQSQVLQLRLTNGEGDSEIKKGFFKRLFSRKNG